MIGWVARCIVGGLFLLAAAGKISEPVKFVDEVRKYGLAPFAATRPIAYVLPWVEVFTAGFLLIGFWRREARVILLAMLAVFTLVKAVVFAQGKEIECGCGGGFDFLKPIFNNPQGIVTNVFLIALLAVDWALSSRRAQSARAPGRPPAADAGAVSAPVSGS